MRQAFWFTFYLVFIFPASLSARETGGSAGNELISVSFQDIPLRNVLALMAEYNDFDIVVSDSVSGDLTLHLNEVPWQQALDIILDIKGLGKIVNGGVIVIAPQEELDKKKEREQERIRSLRDQEVLHSEVILVSYAKASDIAAMIISNKDSAMLSVRGSVSIDERTNALLVRESRQNIAMIKKLVKTLDVPVRQVEIEARLVSVAEGNLEELGVRWGVSGVDNDLAFSGSVEGNRYLMTPGKPEDLSLDDMLNVNLGAKSINASSLAFTVGKVSDVLLDLELSALQAESKAEIISNPHLITTDRKPAYIEQGTEIPYLEATSSGATSISFKKAVLSLKVTPQITPDNRMILDLDVTQDKPGEVVKTGLGEAVAIDTQRIGTQVLVDDGETIVLGGIFQHDTRSRVEKVPLLGDLPGIGHLFRRTYENQRKSELLIFVTPKVIIK